MTETYPYDHEMHYIFPRTSLEQARDELRQYPEASEFRKNLVGLKRMYAKTACMASMERYSLFASGLHGSDGEQQEDTKLNKDFYSGALMAVHVDVSPKPAHLKQHVLRQNFLEGIDENPMMDTIAHNISEHMEEWSGGEEDNWHVFLTQQHPAFADVAVELAMKLYEDKPGAEERQLDFLVGFTYATNLIHNLAQAESSVWPPV